MVDRAQRSRVTRGGSTLQGDQPFPSSGITRRTFLHRSILSGAAAGAASAGWLPIFNTVDLAFGAEEFKFAVMADTHLYPKTLNTRFVDKAVKAVQEIKAMSPAADFFVLNGDIAQLGKAEELELGRDILNELPIKKMILPGEHDWYLDMGKKWEQLFGATHWTFDHKGVRFIGLDTVSHAPDYWSAKKMSPEVRMGHMANLDSSVAGAWAAVGKDQLVWLDHTLAGWPKDKPVVLFGHNPLYEYYPPWNFWVRDWREVHEILKPFSNVTNIHAHTHQVLYNQIGKIRFLGVLATSWPWPYAPEGVPALTRPMVRADPGDHFDGVGWGKLAVSSVDKVDQDYMMWREDVFADAAVVSGAGDNVNQILSPRVADRMWPY